MRHSTCVQSLYWNLICKHPKFIASFTVRFIIFKQTYCRRKKYFGELAYETLNCELIIRVENYANRSTPAYLETARLLDRWLYGFLNYFSSKLPKFRKVCLWLDK